MWAPPRSRLSDLGCRRRLEGIGLVGYACATPVAGVEECERHDGDGKLEGLANALRSLGCRFVGGDQVGDAPMDDGRIGGAESRDAFDDSLEAGHLVAARRFC